MKYQSAGGVQSFVSLTFLRNYVIPIPPLAEQKRIVDKLDELMANCDLLETKAEVTWIPKCRAHKYPQTASSIVAKRTEA